MDVVKLPKKVRMVCYEIMDGKEGALDTLESFADQYPHQVAAVKAEVAYFNLDYEKALAYFKFSCFAIILFLII